uniref:Uncharacterized protein n=1 Tax=Sphaerodactylus townsendi TaxID=933632 RepID=A0ACB8FNH1_9SAUR
MGLRAASPPAPSEPDESPGMRLELEEDPKSLQLVNIPGLSKGRQTPALPPRAHRQQCIKPKAISPLRKNINHETASRPLGDHGERMGTPPDSWVVRLLILLNPHAGTLVIFHGAVEAKDLLKY